MADEKHGAIIRNNIIYGSSDCSSIPSASEFEGKAITKKDLNTMNVYGIYYTRTAAESNGLTNTPKDGQWIGAVNLQCYNIGYNNVVQVITDGITMYYRACYGTATAETRNWRPWKKITAETA